MCGLCEAYNDGKDYRQCIACEYICSDERAWNEDPPWPCPSCKRLGHWSDDVDWTTPAKAVGDLAKLSRELGE